jgi:hypothetical protein
MAAARHDYEWLVIAGLARSTECARAERAVDATPGVVTARERPAGAEK